MVHCFEQGGIRLALDVASGAVHMLDPIAYRLCEKLTPPLKAECPESIISQFSPEEADAVREAYSELYELYQEGLLFSEEEPLPEALIKPTDSPVKALCLHVSHDCNLRCSYCFAQTGDFGTVRSLMDVETAKKAIDFVIERSGKRRNIEIDFFGGEPLMAMDTVRAAVEYAREQEKIHDKQFRFTITTNGVLLDDDTIEYLNREMSNVVLSLDGRRSVNDSMRKTVAGGGSYDVVLPKMQKLVRERDSEKDYYVRGTYTAHNLDFVEDVLSLYRAGFDQISVEPVTAPDGCGYEIKESDLPRIREGYHKLAKTMLEMRQKGEWFNFFHFNVDLEQGPCVIKRLRGCGAGCEYVAVTPEGDIYPCHQFVGEKDYYMGNVKDGSFSREQAREFAGVNVYTRPACRDCWAKFYCSGGCSAANFHAHGRIDQSYEIGCELEKMRLECALYLAAHDSMDNE